MTGCVGHLLAVRAVQRDQLHQWPVEHPPLDERTAEALRRVLTFPVGAADTLPGCLTRRRGRFAARGDDDAGVVESVVLAITNHRWTAIDRLLLERLTDDGLLDEGHASQLAL